MLLDVAGFRPIEYNSNIIETLIPRDESKKMIKDLVATYMRDLKIKKQSPSTERSRLNIRKPTIRQAAAPSAIGGTTWSADFVEGKGDGLIIMLHGKPGVGKTYTAGKCRTSFGCISHGESPGSDLTKRHCEQNALLSLLNDLSSPLLAPTSVFHRKRSRGHLGAGSN